MLTKEQCARKRSQLNRGPPVDPCDDIIDPLDTVDALRAENEALRAEACRASAAVEDARVAAAKLAIVEERHEALRADLARVTRERDAEVARWRPIADRAERAEVQRDAARARADALTARIESLDRLLTNERQINDRLAAVSDKNRARADALAARIDEIRAVVNIIVHGRAAQLAPCEAAGGAIEALRGKLSEAEFIRAEIGRIAGGAPGPLAAQLAEAVRLVRADVCHSLRLHTDALWTMRPDCRACAFLAAHDEADWKRAESAETCAVCHADPCGCTTPPERMPTPGEARALRLIANEARGETWPDVIERGMVCSGWMRRGPGFDPSEGGKAELTPAGRAALARYDPAHKAPRCVRTGNPCGTDTWMVGDPCRCAPCTTWLAAHEVKP